MKNGWLVEHHPTPQKIADLLGGADRDLRDCNARGLSADWRLNIAYNAALQAAVAALAASGYRAGHEAHHYRVIEALAYSIEPGGDMLETFQRLRKKRNVGEY